jgi:hypothetical protein
MHFKKIFPLLIAILALPFAMKAQVTTGTITGNVTSNDGKGLSGASIVATLEATGSVYKTVSKANGLYNIPNLRVGGPYVVVVTYVGYNAETYKDLYVTLGNPLVINPILSTNAQVLDAVKVTSVGGGKGVINSQRNGTSTNISARLVQSLPTINRNVQDFARLTPQVKAGNNGNDGSGSGLSFAGQSNRYNQFSIDGANASDAFGLGSSGTNGGQANVNPISIEAVQELQIVLSPYDVTQGGFTGGGINAVTKSGTNKFHGSVYGNYQNESFVGKNSPYNPSITRAKYGDFKNQTFGASLGGAIIKNKLFFFASYERFEKSTPLGFDPTIAGSGSNVNKDTLQAIKDFMQKTYGYDLGSYGAISNKNQSNSVFGRIDWNISDKHKLTLRHNYVDGSNDIRSRSANVALFENTGYQFTTNSNSTVVELNSTFSSSSSNVLRVTYNRIRDERISQQAPNLFISNFDGTRSISYNLGSDFSSAANSLDQDIVSVTDNYTLYRGKHNFTFGTSNEFFKSGNVFLQGFYGAYTYNKGSNSRDNLTNWFNNNGVGLTQYQVGYSTAGRGDRASANLKSAQFSVYGQDVWSPSKNFKLTYGIRFDLPVVYTKPAENPAFNAAFAALGVKTNQTPDRKLMYSPRVGFNWDVMGDQKLQLRGGVGMFTGRVPFVWVSNQLSNTGIATKNITLTAAQATAAGVRYVFNPSDPQLGAYIPAASSNAATAINVIDKNFKFPQVFRANLAADRKLGAGFVATVELLFTKNINNANYTNLNISENGESTVALGPTVRPYWSIANVNPSYLQVIKLDNTSKGYSVNATAQIQKTFKKGLSGSLAYTFGTASSLNDIPSSVALSNWRGVTTVNGLNKLPLSTSNFDMGSRVTGFISKEFKYAGHFATTVTLFYTGQTGQRTSYVYAALATKNITGDDASSTSLIYIPANFSEANFVDITGGKTASQQWADYQAFAASNKYFTKHAGENASRNGDKLPFENHFDIRIAQDFLLKGQKLQVFVDVINVGALIDKNGGRAYGSGTTPDGLFPLTTTIFTPVTGTTLKRDGVAVPAATANNPAFNFNVGNFTNIGGTPRPYNVNNFTSRWNSQIGVRYSF